jgi:membrane-associated phospholipid phosphatase
LRFRYLSISVTLCVQALFAQVEPNAGKWRTWVLSSAAQVRLPAPPNASDSAVEIQTLKSLMRESTADVKAQIAYWDSGSPGYRWIQLGSQQLLAQNIAPTLYTRAMALLSVAMYDATVAAWDSKFAYNRPHPSAADSSIQPLVNVLGSPSYPSEHAVAAGAASVVLAYLLPNAGETYTDLAEEAARSRLYAGAAYPTDIAAGLQLGRQVGQMAIALAQADRSTAPFTGSFPPAPGVWSSTAPVTPLAGTWVPWVLTSGSDFRLPQPPAGGSQENGALVAEVKNFARTNASNHSAWFWQPSFATPWLDTLSREIFENHLDGNAPRAARAYALETIAQHDATIACWDTKYAYLELRPSMADSTIVTLFANPQHPGFPSGHACASGSSAAVMQYLFPSDAQAFAAMAADAGISTFDAAIHNTFDVSQGLALGGKVGQKVVDRARTDGAQ